MANTPMVDGKGYIDVHSALKLKEAEGRVEVDKLHAEADARFRELLIKESAKETASKHLAKFAGLITLVVTSLSTILKGIVENGHEEGKGDTK